MAAAVCSQNGIHPENRSSLFTLTAPDYLSQYAVAPYKKVLSQEEKDEIEARRYREESERKEKEESNGTCVLQ